VQLTWLANYRLATQKLRAHADAWGHPEWKTIDLVRNPSLALNPDVSYFITSVGMREGWFGHWVVRDSRGRVVRSGNYKLSDFFNAQRTDWVGARRTVNGTDRAALIAADAQKMHRLLGQSFLPCEAPR
jgi:putative chitinase